MVNNNRHAKTIFFIFASLSAAMCVFRFILVFNFTDSNGLYTSKLAGNTFAILAAIFAFSIIAVKFVLQKKILFSLTETKTRSSSTAALLMGIIYSMLFLYAICSFVIQKAALDASVSRLYENFYVSPAEISAAKSHRLFSLGVILTECALCIPCAAYFFKKCFSKKANAAFSSILSLCPALHFALLTVVLFLDTEKQINASARSFTLLTFVCIMMFFVSEAGLAVPKREEEKNYIFMNSKLWAYFAFSIAAFSCVIACILPNLIFTLTNSFDIKSLLYAVLCLCCSLYAFAKARTFF